MSCRRFRWWACCRQRRRAARCLRRDTPVVARMRKRAGWIVDERRSCSLPAAAERTATQGEGQRPGTAGPAPSRTRQLPVESWPRVRYDVLLRNLRTGIRGCFSNRILWRVWQSCAGTRIHQPPLLWSATASSPDGLAGPTGSGWKCPGPKRRQRKPNDFEQPCLPRRSWNWHPSRWHLPLHAESLVYNN